MEAVPLLAVSEKREVLQPPRRRVKTEIAVTQERLKNGSRCRPDAPLYTYVLMWTLDQLD